MRALTSQKVTDAVREAKGTLAALSDKVFTNTEAAAFVSLAMSFIRKHPKPLTDDQGNAAYGSIMHLFGKQPSKELLVSNFYRLLANWQFIDEGIVIPQWEGQATQSDLAFLAVEKHTQLTAKKRLLYNVRTRLKTGLCAGIITWVPLSELFIYRFLDRISGTRKFKCAAEEIAGMEARAIVQINNGKYVLSDVSVSQKQKETNQAIASARSAVDKCVRGGPCNTCSATVADCPLAVYYTGR